MLALASLLLLAGMTGEQSQAATSPHPQQASSPTGVVPQLESRPGAAGLIYLEFQGASVHDTYWNANNPFVVLTSGLSTTQIRQVYETVKEDFLPFAINVTTKKALYDARSAGGPPYKRMRVIFTPTDQWLYDWFPESAGRGVSSVDSFRYAGVAGKNRQADIPVFIYVYDFDAAGNAIESGIQLGAEASHEVGHTMGLAHDGFNYPAVGIPLGLGLGSGRYFRGTGRAASSGPYGTINGIANARFAVWAPLMGANEGGWITQWSNGDYLSSVLNPDNYVHQANPDDVAVIAGLQPDPNGEPGNAVGYAVDATAPGSTLATAKNLALAGTSLSGNSSIGRNANGSHQSHLWKLVLPSSAGIPPTARLDIGVTPAEPMPASGPLAAQQLNLGIANLFMKASLLDANLGLIMELTPGSASYVGSGMPPDPTSLNPTAFLRRSLQGQDLSGGTYYLKIEPSGYGDPDAPIKFHSVNGGGILLDDVPALFTSYGSMGAYSITGSWTYLTSITGSFASSGTAGVPFSYQIAATNGPVSYSATGLPANLLVNASTGLISGVPTTAGVYSVSIEASNGYTSNSETLTLTIQPALGLATAVDSTLLWTLGGNATWIGQSSVTHDGIDAAQSGLITHSQHSWMETAVMGPATVSFWWKVSSEATFDFLEFSIDGTLQPGRISGEVNWQQQTYGLTAGSHTLRWRYTKDASRSAGSDVGWVDQFVYAATSPVITSGSVATGVEGQPFTYQITASGGPITYDAVGLPGGLSVNASTGLVSGIPAVAGISNVTVIATSPVGSGNRAVALTVRPTLNNAVDTPALVFNSSGAAPWFGQQRLAIYLGDAAQSGPITHAQQSVLSTTVTGPGQLTFLWHTECEAIDDYCKLEIDGVEQKRLSGVSAWFSESVAVAAGPHTAAWTYVKNGSVSLGTDAAYLDQVAVSGSFPNITGPLTMNLTVGIGGAYEITADNSPTSFSVDGPLPPGAWFYSPTIHSIFAISPSRAGVYTVPVSVTNVIGTTQASITFSIETAYSGWARSRGLSGANAQPTADGDRDGISNLREMALNLNPAARNDGFQPLSIDPTTRRLRAAFQRNSTYADLLYEVQASTDLNGWASIARSSDGNGVQNLGGAFSVSEVQIPSPPYQWFDVVVLDGTTLVDGIRRFVRIKITQQ